MAMAAPIGIGLALLAETWSLLLATRSEVSKGWTRIHFEMDSAILVNLLQKKGTQTSWIIHTMLQEIHHHLHHIGQFTINHVYREVNQAADGLAKHATRLQLQAGENIHTHIWASHAQTS